MPTEIRFRLNHLYQGPNAPFLHAADAGLFADNDIAVSFIEGFSSSQVARAIAAGEADAGFGDVSSTFELALRAGSVPVTCLLPVFARSPCCLGYLPQARPLALGDLGGATLCGPDGDTSARLLPLLLARNGLTDVRYNYLAVSPPERDRLVAAREVLAATCFDSTLKFAMRSRGYDSSALRFLYFADNGLDLHSAALLCSTALAEAHPILAAKLASVTRETWAACRADPELGVTAAMRRNPALDSAIVRDHLVWVLDHQAFPNGDNAIAFAVGDARTAATLDAAVFTTGIEPPDRPALIQAVCGALLH
jgi:ABC-type nitrate/sulfonate/bicarbonate transport system substrate-binding protein